MTVSDEDKKYTHIALLVLPEEAEILALAAESGTLSLTLRNPNDTADEKRDNKVTDKKTLLTGTRSDALAVARKNLIPNLPVVVKDTGPMFIDGAKVREKEPSAPVANPKP